MLSPAPRVAVRQPFDMENTLMLLMRESGGDGKLIYLPSATAEGDLVKSRRFPSDTAGYHCAN